MKAQRTVRFEGIVKWFNSEKRFGFITRDSGEDIFVHGTGINGTGYLTLLKGQRVSFVVRDEPQRGIRAAAVEILEGATCNA